MVCNLHCLFLCGLSPTRDIWQIWDVEGDLLLGCQDMYAFQSCLVMKAVYSILARIVVGPKGGEK